MNPDFFSLAIISLEAFSWVSLVKCVPSVRARTIRKYYDPRVNDLRAASSKCVNTTPRLQSVFYMRNYSCVQIAI